MDNYHNLRQKPDYKLWRANVYQRDKWRCKICKNKKRIEAHHIYPLRLHYKKRLELDNGITLCFRCHRLIFGKELLTADWLRSLINKNDANSVELQEDNTEPSRGGNSSEGVTTRFRRYRIEQFINKQVKCVGCGKMLIRHYYRVNRSKKFLCSEKCRSRWQKTRFKGSKNPMWKPIKKTRCRFCKKWMLPTKSSPHRRKLFCDNSCQSKYLWRITKRKPNDILRGRWAKIHKCCKECGIKEKPHYGKGLCMTCYNAQYNASNKPTKALIRNKANKI